MKTSHTYGLGQQTKTSIATIFALATSLTILAGCPGTGGGGNGGTDEPDRTISVDTTLATMTIPAGEVWALSDNAKLTVTGDSTITGTLMATDARVILKVDGDLTIGGTITSQDSSDTTPSDGTEFNEHPSGIYLVVGAELTLTSDAVLQTDGNVLITDTEDVLTETPDDLFNEVEDVSGDELDTLVPLPPDNSAFDGAAPKLIQSKKQSPNQQAAGLPITIAGTWPNPADPAPAGDNPVIIFRFFGNRILNLNGWTVNGPPAPNGDNADPDNGTGPKNGKNGMRLNIWNNGGPINLNNVVLNMTNGGDGGSDSDTCGSATGKDGGKSGNFRMTASGGINFNGPVTLNPGTSGGGGDATVTKGAPGADGCPGEDGESGTATGGNGADNKKRIFARGNVSNLANLTIGDLVAGNGGTATADACDGGDGFACCAGGNGAKATATGGNGGESSLNIGTLPVIPGSVIGGDGGVATTTGANGGDGGDCKFGDGGDGGDGGDATSTGGAGGDASGGAASTGGDGGDAITTSGNGGNGGDSGFGTPGAGGAKGSPTATVGTGGTGDTAGNDGDDTPTDGADGAPGGQSAVFVWCLPIPSYVNAVPGVIDPGTYSGSVLDETEVDTVGQINVEFLAIEGTEVNYQRGEQPDHFGVGNGQLNIDVSSLQLDRTGSGIVGGLRIVPLQGFGISAEAPLEVRALDANGEIIGTQTFDTIPNNFTNQETPTELDALFNVDASVASFQVVVPDVAFVTITRLYLLDP